MLVRLCVSAQILFATIIEEVRDSREAPPPPVEKDHRLQFLAKMVAQSRKAYGAPAAFFYHALAESID
ncbi:MAG: hypothetical protein P4L78_10280 [Silvimonas sp.]|nr:hypothetical protein [Silvimonas sp.]